MIRIIPGHRLPELSVNGPYEEAVPGSKGERTETVLVLKARDPETGELYDLCDFRRDETGMVGEYAAAIALAYNMHARLVGLLEEVYAACNEDIYFDLPSLQQGGGGSGSEWKARLERKDKALAVVAETLYELEKAAS